MNSQEKIEKLQTIVNGVDPTEVSIVVETEVKLLKTGNPLKDNKVSKTSLVTLTLNQIYEEVVNEQLEKEGKETDFKSQSAWYQNLLEDNNYLICNKKDNSKVYIKGIVKDTKHISYLVDGVGATEEQLEYINTYKPKTSAPSNQGTETPVIIRTYSIDGLLSMNVGEVEYLFY